METIGKRIRSVRQRENLTQEEFAKKICVCRPHVTNIEKGKDNPSKAVIRLISILFDVSEDWLVNGKK